MTRRCGDGGVVLVNVLVVLAIAGGLMLLLISSQEAALNRVARAADAAVVEQIALGAEASVIDALRRDLDTSPETDHFNEPWAKGVIQDEVLLPTGRFSVAITDMQAKFDVNQLINITAGTQEFARRLMIAVDQPPEVANQIVRILDGLGPIADFADLAAFGVSQEALDALAPFVTALPVAGTINLNSVDPALLEIMMQNRSQALQLVRTRDSQGYLSLDALRSVGALRPQNSGFTSNVFLVEILAEAGDARTLLHSMLVRRNARGIKAVEVLERHFVYDSETASTNESGLR